MSDTPKNSELFFDNVFALPMWARQVMYRKLEASLKKELANFMGLLNPERLLQELSPKLTFKGKQELEEKKAPGMTGEHYIFLANLLNNNTIFEIAVNNFWTLANVCKLLIKCVEHEYIEPFTGDGNYAIAQFLAGRIRTGELLRKLGQLDVMQLEQALREQKTQKEAGHDVKIAEVMISLGFVREEDVNILFRFKDDADKRFIMGLGLTTIKFEETDSRHKQLIMSLQREFKKLDQENRILKTRLKKILNIQG